MGAHGNWDAYVGIKSGARVICVRRAIGKVVTRPGLGLEVAEGL